MGEAAPPPAVVLAVNGERYEAAGADPSTTLLEFLRTRTPVRGPKLGCGEGTCHLSLVHPLALAPAFISGLSSMIILAQEEINHVARTGFPQSCCRVRRVAAWPSVPSLCRVVADL